MGDTHFSGKVIAGSTTGAETGTSAAIASLTDSSGGTANDTIEDVPAAYNEAALANNFADLTAKVNAILAALRTAGIISP